jgi:2-alkyl-3-oxoalkanoate reductase
MRVFVTGGTGFVGSALVRRLLDDGHSVVVLDLKPGLAHERLKEDGAELVFTSVTNREAVARCCEGAEVVMHLADAIRDLGASREEMRSVNVDGTRIVAEEAAKAGVRKLVYSSTEGVHGHVENPPGDEDSPISPADEYQQAKYDGELELRILDGTPFEYTILRPTTIYGPGDRGRFQGLFERVKSGNFPIFGDGQTLRHPVYIDNLIDAFMLAMEPDRGASEACIIGDAEYFTIEELVRRAGQAVGVDVEISHYPAWPLVAAGHMVETVCKPLGIEPPIFSRQVDWFRQARAFRIDKARRELGYEPRVDIDTGLRRAAEWYLASERAWA